MTRFAIVGAGSIGCWVGGRLAANGAAVTLIGRKRVDEALADGFRTTDLNGTSTEVARSQFTFATGLEAASDADVVLVCVKGPDTAQVAATLSLQRTASVVSLQNGIGSAEALSDVFGPERVVPGVVVFNVVRPAANVFHRATEGAIILPDGRALELDGKGLPIERSPDIEGSRWGKLMLNLNNGPNVLSGLPLRDHLLDRDWRRVFARCIAEGLAVAKAKGVGVRRIGKVHPRLARHVLPLPTPLFERIARSMMRIDPAARTSMVDDLEAGRTPEIDMLNGAIVSGGAQTGTATPVNDAVVAAVRSAFEAGESPHLSGTEFKRRYGV